MDTLAQIYARHSGGVKFNDKGSTHSYIEVYEELLAPYRETSLDIIEIGLYDGHSYLMWKEYFTGGYVFGIDVDEQPLGKVDLRPVMDANRNFVTLCDGSDEKEVEMRFPLEWHRWDVVIDDAAHTLEQQLKIYSVWKERLRPGAIYIIEDIQDIDRDRHHFEELGFKILDRRSVKGRYDDVLAVIGGKR